MTIRHERVRFPPRGLLGGKPGRAGRDLVNGQLVPAKARIDLAPGDLVTFETPGGGGYGPPIERAPAAIEADLREGFVTAEGAARAYPAVIAKVSPDA